MNPEKRQRRHRTTGRHRATSTSLRRAHPFPSNPREWAAPERAPPPSLDVSGALAEDAEDEAAPAEEPAAPAAGGVCGARGDSVAARVGVRVVWAELGPGAPPRVCLRAAGPMQSVGAALPGRMSRGPGAPRLPLPAGTRGSCQQPPTRRGGTPAARPSSRAPRARLPCSPHRAPCAAGLREPRGCGPAISPAALTYPRAPS